MYILSVIGWNLVESNLSFFKQYVYQKMKSISNNLENIILEVFMQKYLIVIMIKRQAIIAKSPIITKHDSIDSSLEPIRVQDSVKRRELAEIDRPEIAIGFEHVERFDHPENE